MMATNPSPCTRRNIELRRHRHGPRRSRATADSLQSAWLAWRLRHPASHDLTRAAAELHVPEAHLLAAIEGNGVTALHPDLPDLLSTAASWGRLEIDIPHGLGRVQMRMTPTQVSLKHPTITLAEGPRHVDLSTQGVASCYLVSGEMPDQHSLQWFGRDGHAIARLRMLDPGQHLVLPHLLQSACADLPDGPPPHLEQPPELQLPADWCALDTLIRPGTGLVRITQSLPQALTHIPAARLRLPGRGLALSCTGTIATTLDSATTCSLRIEPGRLAHAYVCVAPDGTPFLRLHAHDESWISLQPMLDPTSAWAWIDMLVPSRRA
ncbi:MAG: hem utilization ChuX/HutX [Pseudomonadota bacterium]|jgi:hypothetical protein